MDPDPHPGGGDSARLDEAIASFLEAQDGGEEVDLDGFLARHRDVGPRLEAFLVGAREVARSLQAEAPSVDGYSGLRAIGRGGMGVVYSATRRIDGARVAIKTPRPDLPVPSALDRFRIEAEAARKLDHPHIVPILDVGESGGRPYFAMKWVDGVDLGRHLGRDRVLAPDEAARLVATLAGAVQHAHLKGVLHLDLKPANVLLGADGHPYLTDFGLARTVEAGSNLTKTAAILGTPSYMAPEQADGRRGETNPATDVYGLGAILYRSLTARPPFVGRTDFKTYQLVIRGHPDSIRKLDPDLPVDLDVICGKCLRKDPRRRYRSALELADDLGRFLRREPIAARPPSPLDRLIDWSKDNPTPARLAVALALAIAVLSGGAVASAVGFRWRNAALTASKADLERNKSLLIAESVRLKARERQLLAKQAELDASLYQQRIETAERELTGGDGPRAEGLLLDCPEALRGWEWAHLRRRRFEGPPRIIESTAKVGWAVAFNPDGSTLATTGGGRTVELRDSATGMKRWAEGMLAEEGPAQLCQSIAFRADGKRVAWGSVTQHLGVRDVADGRSIWSVKGIPGLWCVTFTPDGKEVVTADFEGVIRARDAADGRLLRELGRHDDRARRVVALGDGRVISSGDDGSVRAWDLQGAGPPRPPIAEGLGPVSALAVDPTGRTLAAGTEGGVVLAWDAPTGRLRFRAVAHRSAVGDIAISPDGRLIASGGADRTVRLRDSASGRELIALRGHRSDIRGVAFSPDGHRIASTSADGETWVWDARPWDGKLDGAGRVIAVPRGVVRGVVFAKADGGIRWVAASEGDRVDLHDPETGQSARSLIAHDEVTLLALSPDGRRAAASGPGRTVSTFELDGEGRVGSIEGFRRAVSAMEFSPDGRYLAIASDRDVRVVEPFGAGLRWQDRWLASCLRFSTDGRALAGSGSTGARLWVAADGETLATMKAEASAMAFGRRVALTDLAGRLAVFELPRLNQAFLVRPHAEAARCVAFSPDGRRVATGSDDGRVVVLDARDGHQIADLRNLTGPVASVAFSPDGRRLVAHGHDRLVAVWDATAPSLDPTPSPASSDR